MDFESETEFFPRYETIQNQCYRQPLLDFTAEWVALNEIIFKWYSNWGLVTSWKRYSMAQNNGITGTKFSSILDPSPIQAWAICCLNPLFLTWKPSFIFANDQSFRVPTDKMMNIQVKLTKLILLRNRFTLLWKGKTSL